MRYEDLASNTSSVLRQLYQQLGVPYSEQVERVAFGHTHAENGTVKVKEVKKNNPYYSTLRKSNFNINSWQKRLGMKAIRNIEGRCQALMDTMGYRRFNFGQENLR